MRTIVVSDVHLGSRHSRADRFLRFLDELPEGARLVLNGDSLDRIHVAPAGTHREALERLVAESYRRHVVWVYGNHDEGYRPGTAGRIEFATCHAIGKRLFISHGFDFDNIMPCNRPFIHAFRFLHRLRVLMGAEAVHVAQYAKRFASLYAVLRRNVAMNAREYARENGFEAVTCGHTHFAEDTQLDGVRYLNTGAWTEEPVYCVDVEDGAITLRAIAAGAKGARP